MSYILDALNKADTERERKRSAVPGLQAQTDHGVERESRSALWRNLALGAMVALAALVAWLWLGRSETAPTPTAASVPVLAMAPPVAVSPPQVSVAPSPVTAAVTVAPAPRPRQAPTVPMPMPMAVAPAATPAKATAAATPTASAPARLPSRHELAPELRAALPSINISGAVYAPQPAGRLLFVNGLVLHEGDAVADGLTIERIGAAASVLIFRGQRFELKH